MLRSGGGDHRAVAGDGPPAAAVVEHRHIVGHHEVGPFAADECRGARDDVASLAVGTKPTHSDPVAGAVAHSIRTAGRLHTATAGGSSASSAVNTPSA